MFFVNEKELVIRCYILWFEDKKQYSRQLIGGYSTKDEADNVLFLKVISG